MTDKTEPVAWMYERKPEAWPPAHPVVQLTRWAKDDPARPYWTETPLYAHAPATRPAPVDACPSCGGQNTSCPNGCGRDPKTGELDGTRLSPAPADGLVGECVMGDDCGNLAALRAQSEGEAEREALRKIVQSYYAACHDPDCADCEAVRSAGYFKRSAKG